MIVIIKIFDVGKNIPDKFFDENYPDKEEIAVEKEWLTSQEQYALEMLTEKRNEIPFLVSMYPMIYCVSTILVTLLLKKQICEWFDVILYSEDEQQAEENRRRLRRQQLEEEDLDGELTLNSDDEEDQ